MQQVDYYYLFIVIFSFEAVNDICHLFSVTLMYMLMFVSLHGCCGPPTPLNGHTYTNTGCCFADTVAADSLAPCGVFRSIAVNM